MRPFLKWAGGKYRLLHHIHNVLPKGNRLIEPFAGSAAVFLNTQYNKYIIADTNSELINLYSFLQTEKNSFIKYCRHFFIPENNSKEKYHQLRDKFNSTKNKRLKAALFLYLNRHGYNGLCRYNSQGKYNVPFGLHNKPFFPLEAMSYFINQSQKASFIQADFTQTMQKAKKGDVIYCDPPYVPLTETANFTHYHRQNFSLDAQIKLAQEAERLANKHIPVIISNHDTEFTREIYKNSRLIFFDVQRYISRDISNRKKVKELLAVYN
jgi:DNA adenine methylase